MGVIDSPSAGVRAPPGLFCQRGLQQLPHRHRRPSVTTVAPKPIVTRPWPVRPVVKGSALGRLLRTTDAKLIGVMYLVTSFVWFFVGGFPALIIRPQLDRP